MTSSQKYPAPKLRCFIAMAFDREDTDCLFDALEAVLKRRNIRPIRVDRLEHNDDIDDRIITEIKKADFMIADLTYARPSVYFEAGFAQRNIPVIYTARHDHLRPKTDDPDGNLRVHFDLQMKNIIVWKSGGDRRFQQRLESRVSHVVAPLLRQRVADEIANRRTEDYERQSLHERCEYLRTCFRRHFRRLKYPVEEVVENRTADRVGLLSLGPFFRGGLVCAKRDATRFRYVSFKVFPSVTKEVCNGCRLFLIRQPPYSQRLFNKPEWTPTSLSEDIVICSFGKSGVARMAQEIPSLRRDGHALNCSTTWDIIHPGRAISVAREVRVHVIESIPALANFADELKSLFPVDA